MTHAASDDPVPGAVLDVWQAGADGLYSTQDPSPGQFRLRGRMEVAGNGRYESRTVVPPPREIPKDGPVGSLLRGLGRDAIRPAHIHVKVTADGYRPLTTMMFVSGDPYLESDPIDAVKDSLVVPLERHESEEERVVRGVGDPFFTCRFDVALVAA